MLARVAESLYWIGRNIERSEHCSRYLKVQYYSTLDSPMLNNKDFTLRSIMFMSGSDFDMSSNLNEKDVWKNVIFDGNNVNSIFSIIKNARENARSIRNNISIELWESINKWFLFCKNYNAQNFNSGKIYDFTDKMTSHIAVIKSNISNTLLHDNIWHFMSLGVFIERCIQVLRILRSKISDWIILSDNGVNKALMVYQWTILLKSLEAFDVHNYYYKGQRSRSNIFKLILDNPLFPRSVSYTVDKIYFHLSRISVKPQNYEKVIENTKEDLDACLDFYDFSNEESVVQNIDQTYKCISKIHFEIEKMYFK